MRSITGEFRTGANGDADLVVAARGGSTHAREVLFRRHVNLVHGMAFRLSGRLADHRAVADEIFGQVFSTLDQLAHPDALRPWIAGLIVRAARRAIWRRRLLCRLGIDVVASPHFEAVLRDAPADVRRELDRVYRDVERLPMKLRTAFLLRRIEGLALPDIAMAMDASLAQVRRWVARAEARLGIDPRAAAAAKATA